MNVEWAELADCCEVALVQVAHGLCLGFNRRSCGCNTNCWFVAFATHLDRTRALSGILLVSAGARPVHARRDLRRGAPSGRDTDLFHRQGGRFGPAHDGRGDRRVRAGVIRGGSRCGFCVHGSNASTTVEIRTPWLPKSKVHSFFYLAILMWLPWLHLRHSVDVSVKTESTHRVSISMWLRCQAYSTILDSLHIPVNTPKRDITLPANCFLPNGQICWTDSSKRRAAALWAGCAEP